MHLRSIFSFIIFSAILVSCRQDNYSPKPNGYIRIYFPEKNYIHFDNNLPYTFDYPAYGTIKPDTDKNAEPYWINIEFPQYHGKIHLSYKKIEKNLSKYIEDSRKMAYKHTIKADAIDEQLIIRDSLKVYGILYDIKGNTASSVQFFLTDSTKNFLRGALYFSASPNKDSLAPIIEFFKADVNQLIKTLNWN
jgi:gliding motility-associated lipoprotein GldD